MKIIKSKNQITFFYVLLIGILIILFCLSVYIITSTKSPNTKIAYNNPADLTYNQIVKSKQNSEENLDYYKSAYDGREIFWRGKISAYYSQITGIKFCIIDEEHQDVDINKPCNWFWASSDKIVDADNIKINPGWDGKWVDYTLNYYKVPFNKNNNFYNNTYWIKGVVKGIDCISIDQCTPDINIISIISTLGPFDSL